MISTMRREPHRDRGWEAVVDHQDLTQGRRLGAGGGPIDTVEGWRRGGIPTALAIAHETYAD